MGEIHTAVDEGDLAGVQAILELDPIQVHARLSEEDADQPLHWATLIDRPDIATILIAAGADVNARGHRGLTPLHFAAYHGSPHTARVLLSNGAEIDVKDEHGFTPLFLASRGRDSESTEVAHLLLTHGAEVDLNTAVCLGDIERVQVLLASDPDSVRNAAFPHDLIYDAVLAVRLHIVDRYRGRATPEDALQSISLYLPMLEMLVAYGADVNGVGLSCQAALLEAVKIEHPALAQWLIDRGANVNYRTSAGITVWESAGYGMCSEEMRALLRAHGVKENRKP
jgi:uncharacterized protein